MTKWALIVDGVVRETTDIDPQGRFHDSLNWQPCSESVLVGWSFKDGIFSAATPEVLTPSQVLERFKQAIQQRLDDFARTRNYDSILSACTYATSTVANFKAEGQVCVELRDATWAAAYGILAEVQAGTRPMPEGIADIESALPAAVWPT